MGQRVRRLYKGSDRKQSGGVSDEKYYIQCDPSQIHSTEFVEWNDRRAILKALLSQKSQIRNRDIVVKLGLSESLLKEYQYGAVLKTIPGFINFICLFQCHDDPETYKHPFKDIPLCQGNADTPRVYGLVMPYLSLGSFRDYSGWVEHPQRFRACFLQLVWSLYEAYTEHGFIHNDIHLNNVLIRRTKKNAVTYKHTTLPTEGFSITVMDFGNSLMPVAQKQNTHFFWKDMQRILMDISYEMKLSFSSLKPMELFLANRSSIPSHEESSLKGDFHTFIKWIEGIQNIQKEAPIPTTFTYSSVIR